MHQYFVLCHRVVVIVSRIVGGGIVVFIITLWRNYKEEVDQE